MIASSHNAGTNTTELEVVSPTDPLQDDTVDITGNCTLHGWAPNDRLLSTCEDGVVTSDADGSDRTVVATGGSSTAPVEVFGFAWPAWSPAGTHVYMTEQVVGSGYEKYRLGVAPDDPSAPITPLTAYSDTDLPQISEAR